MGLMSPDWGLVFWMTVIFLIVLGLLAKFGFPVITESVRKRTEHIDKSLKDAQEVEKRMASMIEEHARMVDSAREEQSRIIKEAAKAKDDIISAARAEAREEAAAILDSAREQIAAEKESALRDVRRQVALLSVSIAEKVLRTKLSGADVNEDYVNKMIDEASTSVDPRKYT